jgi:phosphoenolpyruvate carboxylase
MKSIYTLLFVCMLGTISFAQDVKIAKAQSATELLQAKNTGIYTFVFPSDITIDAINQSANYYTSFFTVELNESTRTAKVTMVESTPANRRVILRFLASTRIQKIKIGENALFLHEFYDQYLD